MPLHLEDEDDLRPSILNLQKMLRCRRSPVESSLQIMVSGEEQTGDISIYRLYQGHSLLIC